MASAKELSTKIILKGQVDPSLTSAFSQVNRATDGSLAKLQSYGQTVAKVMKVAGTAAVVGLGASAKAAIDYESAFAGVMKTVEETKTTTYDDLSQSIRNMAKEMPATTTEIAGVAEAAGQLGIKADDIEKFTKVMINLGTTTNLSSDEAATAIAKMFNITGTSMDNVDRFGATIVALGNNAATTESDIVNMATRIASSATQVGMSEQQMLALATSLSSVGLEAEGGGTAISTVISNIDKAVATNGKTLGTWAETAGMSTADFKKAWESDAYGALQKVIGGMGSVKSDGGNLNLVLEELGITGIRTSDTMKRLSSASGLMGEMTTLANTAWDENTALINEANTRYSTMASRIQILKNRLYDVGITVGEALMPVMEKLMTALENINWDGVANKIVSALNWISEHSTAIIAVIGAVAGAFAGIKIAGFVMAIAKVVMWVKKAVSIFGFMKVALGLLGGPVTIVITVIGLLVGAFVALWAKSEGFRNFWKGLWSSIKSIASSVGEWLKNFFTVTIPNAWNTAVTWFQNGVAKIKTFFSNIGTAISNGFNTALNFIKSLPSRIWTWLLNTINRVNQWRLQMIARAKELGSQFLNAVVNFFKTLPYKLGYFLGFVVTKVILWGKQMYNKAVETGRNFLVAAVNFFAQLPSKIWTWLVNTVNKINQWRLNMLNKAKAIGRQFITAVVNFFRTLPGKVWTWLTNTVQKVTAWGSRMISIGKAKATQFVTSVINYVKQLPSKIWTWLTNVVQKVVSWGTQLASKGKAAAVKLYNSIVDKVKEIPSKMLEIGKNIVEGLWNGIKNAKDWLVGKVKDFAGGVLDGMANAMGCHSPSTITTQFGKWVGQGIPIGLQKTWGLIKTAVGKTGDLVSNGFNAVAPVITPTIGAVKGAIQKFATGGTVTRPQMAVVGDAPETIVPHGNTPRNRALLSEAAKGVGATLGGSNIFNVTFAPVINGGNAEENRKMLLEEEEAFERKMDEYFNKKWRLAF